MQRCLRIEPMSYDGMRNEVMTSVCELTVLAEEYRES